ncbi:hypothetical protein [Silvimonas sp.]|uniref:hypothetical protein n=1 Tax=Silvimonas sp. TaxID=2650811 RepID=UPI00284774AF|nr:hypothetical protein [Silvimonas sp.]MDR3426095.1 hypothetical protein [Silvimonas sp.]
MYLTQIFRLAYIGTAFAGAIVIGACGGTYPPAVHAQDSTLATQVAVNTQLTDQVQAAQGEINRRMDNEDVRLNAMSDSLATIKGAGGSFFVILGVLQILGFIQTGRQSNKATAVAP